MPRILRGKIFSLWIFSFERSVCANTKNSKRFSLFHLKTLIRLEFRLEDTHSFVWPLGSVGTYSGSVTPPGTSRERAEIPPLTFYRRIWDALLAVERGVPEGGWRPKTLYQRFLNVPTFLKRRYDVFSKKENFSCSTREKWSTHFLDCFWRSRLREGCVIEIWPFYWPSRPRHPFLAL